MSRMIELIRQSAVPANTMRTAARGALELPAGEMIEILVYLTSTAIFGEQAKMTLASWDEASAIKVAGDPQTPWEVLAYMVAPQNLRPKLAPALLDNPSIREAALVEMAQNASRELITMMLQSGRCGRSQSILHSLLSNPALSEAESRQVRENLRSLGEETTRIQAYQEADTRQEQKSQYEIDHAAEIAAEEAEAKPFSLIGQEEESFEDLEELEAVAPVEDTPPPAPAPVPEFEVVPSAGTPAMQPPAPLSAEPAVAATATAAAVQPAPAMDAKVRERLSTLQKIARLSVGLRIQLAMKGNREERFILVRDGSKLVSQAVLQSPKVTDSEVEGFAGMKNVQEGVLREIARNHKFMKNYAVVRSLSGNPRCPLDLSLSLMNHLLINDLKALSMNKNIPETLRKLALKKFKEKSEKKHGG